MLGEQRDAGNVQAAGRFQLGVRPKHWVARPVILLLPGSLLLDHERVHHADHFGVALDDKAVLVGERDVLPLVAALADLQERKSRHLRLQLSPAQIIRLSARTRWEWRAS